MLDWRQPTCQHVLDAGAALLVIGVQVAEGRPLVWHWGGCTAGGWTDRPACHLLWTLVAWLLQGSAAAGSRAAGGGDLLLLLLCEAAMLVLLGQGSS